MHRLLWDMHYTPIAGIEPSYPIAAIYRNTAPRPTSPWALPGDYNVTLSANGKSYTQPLTLKMDPRVKASAADLRLQFDLSMKLYELRKQLHPVGKSFDALNKGLTKAKERAGESPVQAQIEAMKKRLTEFAPPNTRPGAPMRFVALENVEQLFNVIEDVDAAPTPRVRNAVAETEKQAGDAVARWQALIANELPQLNQQLSAAGLEPIDLTHPTSQDEEE